MGTPGSRKGLNCFLAEGLAPGALITLEPAEAHHLRHVLRLKEGAPILLLNGQGQEYLGAVARIRRREVLVRVEKMVRHEPPPEKQIIFVLPLLKKERTSFLAEKAVELGVTRLIPFYSRRTVVRVGENFKRRLLERTRQALKQCRRLWALEVASPRPLAELDIKAECKLFAYEAERERSLKRSLQGFQGKSLALLAGPEGGLAPEEAHLLEEQGFVSVTLGPYVLRAETAALYLMSLAHAWAYL